MEINDKDAEAWGAQPPELPPITEARQELDEFFHTAMDNPSAVADGWDQVCRGQVLAMKEGD